ncbi:hypothetical protein C8J57DRAFT_235733 [Mycena rebaudengoi]|nr:hypothetical protein C8J57DRAFT_235733 [Mycena rebaudengoi]
MESESDGADGKEALERFVEARTALVAEAERVRRHSTCPEGCTRTTDARSVTDIIFNLSHWHCPCLFARSLVHPLTLRLAYNPLTPRHNPPTLTRSLTHPPHNITKRLIAASHAPADVTEGSYNIMDSPYLPPHLEALQQSPPAPPPHPARRALRLPLPPACHAAEGRPCRPWRMRR